MNQGIIKVGWGFGRCPLNCEHCYNASKKSGPEYTFAQLKSVADKICPYIKDINYGTGELSYNPNAMDLAEYVAENYQTVRQAVTSSGYSIVMVNPEKVRIFHDVDISLDFPNKEKHNRFRRHNKAWEWVHNSLNILKERDVARSVVTCVTSKTTDDDILGLLKIAKQYGATWRINWFRHTGRGDRKLRITPQRAWEIIEFLSGKVSFQCLDSIFAGPLKIPCKPCPAGHQSCRIHENMDTSCYPFLKGEMWSGGNMLDPDVDLDTIYSSNVFQSLRDRPQNISFCQGCEFQQTCQGGCVTRGFLHNGGIEQPDDYCPVKVGLMDQVKRIRANIKYDPSNDLVHDGYLCTTIMRPLLL